MVTSMRLRLPNSLPERVDNNTRKRKLMPSHLFASFFFTICLLKAIDVTRNYQKMGNSTTDTTTTVMQPTIIVKQHHHHHQQRETMIMQLPDLPQKQDLSQQDQKLNKDKSSNDTYPTILYNSRPGCKFADGVSKFMIMSTPKAGCMQSMQMIFAYWGVLQDALTKHDDSFRSLIYYWHHIGSKSPRSPKPGKKRLSCAGTCQQEDWTCIKIIRNPIDRTVSSYIHIIKHNAWRNFPELHEITNRSSTTSSAREATFEQFVDALELRAVQQLRSVKPIGTNTNNHFLPQNDDLNCDETADYLIPLEATDIGLELVDLQTNLSLPRTKDLISSSHYVSTKVVGNQQAQGKAEASKSNTTVTSKMVDASQISPMGPKCFDNSCVYEYAAYYLNSKINAKVCRLFYIDFQLYAKACQQTIDKFQKLVVVVEEEEASSMGTAAATKKEDKEGVSSSSQMSSLSSSLQQLQQVCENEWQKITNICGETFRDLSQTVL